MYREIHRLNFFITGATKGGGTYTPVVTPM